MNPILHRILSTKRPTNNPEFCASFMSTLLVDLGIEFTEDKHHNFTVQVGNSTSMFTAHTDTVDKVLGTNLLTVDNDGVITVNGGGILGADCGSGIYIMLEMIRAEVPGIYVFFSQEEKGRIGSSFYTLPKKGITRCISFDRAGTQDLITHQMGEAGCSKQFAEYFEQNFPLIYYSDPTGVYTDSYTFFDVIPECINLSVGYYNQHSKFECQDEHFLESLVDACIEFNWELLPVHRDPSKTTAYTATSESLVDFCERFPEVAAAVLHSYGITLDDMVSYTYAPHEEDYYDQQDYHFDRGRV